jgi:hypothetical protein
MRLEILKLWILLLSFRTFTNRPIIIFLQLHLVHDPHLTAHVFCSSKCGYRGRNSRCLCQSAVFAFPSYNKIIETPILYSVFCLVASYSGHISRWIRRFDLSRESRVAFKSLQILFIWLWSFQPRDSERVLVHRRNIFVKEQEILSCRKPACNCHNVIATAHVTRTTYSQTLKNSESQYTLCEHSCVAIPNDRVHWVSTL